MNVKEFPSVIKPNEEDYFQENGRYDYWFTCVRYFKKAI